MVLEQAAGAYARLASDYLQALLSGDRHRAIDMVVDAVDQGVAIEDIYIEVFQTVQHEIGRLWQTNQVSVAQEHFCTAATQVAMSRLYPQMFRAPRIGRTLVATCVGGELHELGIRMVADLFEMAGWDSYYLGANTPARGILDAIVRQEADIVAVSATIHFSVTALTELVQTVSHSPDASTARILVGGRPFTLVDDLWMRVGAHGTAANARDAVSLADQVMLDL